VNNKLSNIDEILLEIFKTSFDGLKKKEELENQVENLDLKNVHYKNPETTDYWEDIVKAKPESSIPNDKRLMNDKVPDSLIPGVGKDAPTVVNDKGGKQSHSPYRFDLIDPDALFEIAKVLGEGSNKYGENNWLLIDIKSNLNHSLQHIYAYLAEDKSDDHLAHAACRIIFALALHKNSKRIQESQVLQENIKKYL